MKKQIVIIILFVAVAINAELLQSGNWRSPYFLMAHEMGFAQESSNSGMFHDGIGNISMFDKALMPDSDKLLENHWFMEPQVGTGLFSDHTDLQDPWLFNLGLLNSISYKNILIRQTLHVDKMYEYDQYYPAHPDRAMRGRIEEAFIQMQWKHAMFRLGRMERNWGPFPDRSLFLSSNPYTYDAFEWQLQSKVFEFRHVFAVFPYKRSEWDTDGRQINRYFTAHALNIIAGKWITAGVFESIVFTREKGFPDFSYVNPFSIYTVTNTNMEGDGNLMIGIQWDIKPFFENISLKGQVAWDDFQVDDEIVTDKEPAHWGMDLGLYWRNPLPVNLKNSFKLEYNIQSKWLYTVPDANTAVGEHYAYLNKSLGFEKNDGYEIAAGYTIAGNKYWAGTVNAGFEKRGGNIPLSKWNDMTHTPGLPYDSIALPVEKTAKFGITVYGYFRDYVNMALTFNNEWVKNRDNLATSVYKYDPQIKAELSIHFSDLIIKLPD